MIFCMIVKDEYPWYIDEWIKYYQPLGKIVIYDNNDKAGSVPWCINDYNQMSVIHFPGRPVQLSAYMDCCKRYPDDAILFVDADEFWVRNKTIMEYELLCHMHGALMFNWQVYGSSGLMEKDSRPQTEKFMYRKPWDSPVNRHIKTMVVGRYVKWFLNPHEVQLVRGKTYNRHGFSGLSREIDLSIGYINHYFTRSKEEFQQKIDKGRADMIGTRTMQEFYDTDRDAKILGGINYANI